MLHRILKTLCLILQDSWDKIVGFFSNVGKKTLFSLDKNKHLGFINILVSNCYLWPEFILSETQNRALATNEPMTKTVYSLVLHVNKK